MPKTRKKPWWSGWRGRAPNKKQRRAMKKLCGKKCFLGPNLSFPVCAKGTCRRNKRGIMSAYIRAKQWGKPRSFYKNHWGKPRMKRKVYTRVAKKARKLMGWKKGGRRRTKRRRRRRSRKKRGGGHCSVCGEPVHRPLLCGHWMCPACVRESQRRWGPRGKCVRCHGPAARLGGPAKQPALPPLRLPPPRAVGHVPQRLLAAAQGARSPAPRRMINFRPLATFFNPQPVGPGALIPLLPPPPILLPNLGEIGGMLQAGKDAPPPLPQPPADVDLQADEELEGLDMSGGGRKRSRRGGVKLTGTIVYWNPYRGNGVITPDHDETQSIGFHFTSAALGRYEPSEGDKVEFNMNNSIPRRAIDVVKLQEPEPMEIDFDQGAQEACKKNQKEKCITYLKELGLSQNDAELVAAPFLSGETHLAELEQKLQALVRIGEAAGGGNQGGGGRKRRKRRRTRRRRGGMNPIGNSGAPNLQEMEGKNQNNQNENTVEIHNVENASGIAMQKQAGQGGVIEGGNTATLKRGPSKTRKRSYSWP